MNKRVQAGDTVYYNGILSPLPEFVNQYAIQKAMRAVPRESGVRRLKGCFTGPGMRWSRPGAERLLSVRTAIMSGRLDAPWQRPTTRPYLTQGGSIALAC